MLDNFTIVTKGGIVLWSMEWAKLKGSPINKMIKKVLLEERSADSSYNTDNYSLKWTFANEFDLIFIAVYQKIFTLMYIDELLLAVKKRFVKMYKDMLVAIKNSADSIELESFKEFDFEVILEEVEMRSKLQQTSISTPKRYEDTTKGKLGKETKREKEMKLGTYEKNKKKEDAKREKKLKRQQDRKARQQEDYSDTDSGSEDDYSEQEENSDTSSNNSKEDNIDENNKENNTKGTTGADDQEDPEITKRRQALIANMKKSPMSKKKSVADKEKNTPEKPKSKKEARKWEGGELTKSEKEALNKSEKSAKKEIVRETIVKHNIDMEVSSDEEDKPASGFMKYFNVLTGNRVITKQDLEPILNDFKTHLTKKNVALDIAEKLVESVGTGLTGKKLSTFQGVTSVVKQTMEEVVTRILTPKRNIDILKDVQNVKGKRPYTIVFSGVNGVGKSTNLAKVCYWLTANGFKVMLAACDTFRSGAIEQLRTHAERLNVQVFERGYGKDAASIAGDAINYAKETGHDVVLIDTTGRMQNNEPLMKALSKLVNQNAADLVLFVGEALVGNDGVDQLTKFDQSLSLIADSTRAERRTIDGIILTKFDTIDDKVGAAISMVYSTGIPIVFLGTGQNYTDLKRMNIKSVVKSLLT
ncbi:hypothetical protein CYY_002694 [Polysphondylium violaceum]|uniref:SRP54-type proteins GTP-binding domain-containing protein n=1 Tax=Polysphondylium violaceum TaxID=133409 RepID=A0A8J4Q0T4_9MYCE|nr:hypothetical protein CYY_002694 [Polysphondylium violaceum]